jgi:hypothetical protein
MAISNQFTPMQFTAGTTWKQDIRTRPSKYAMSDLRNWRFEQSEGVRPAEYMGVYKNLPVALQDTNTEDWVVIPKGRIISSITPFDSTPVSGLAHPINSGTITIANQGDYMGTGTGAKINVNIDSSYFGYEDGIAGLIVPANGGAVYSGYYTSDDVTAGTRAAGGLRAAASGSFVNPANCPIGVAFTDVYQDIRGEWINYRMHPDGYHFLTDWYVEVPFVNYSDSLAASGCNPVVASADYTNTVLWRSVNKSFTYLAFDGTTSAPKAGQFVTSDGIGNYAIQSAATLTTASGVSVTGLTAYNMPKTPQTVGKLIALDTRMPKHGLDDVLTYPRSGMPGSQTAGMIKNLFDFAYYCLYIGTGTAPSVEAIFNAIRSGAFGLARIQLLVS